MYACAWTTTVLRNLRGSQSTDPQTETNPIAFVAGWEPSIIGALQTALYALIVLAAGVVLYHEHLTGTQEIGILFAFGGVVLINWP